MIVDAHCHAGRGDGLTGPWNTDAPIEPYLRRARAAGINKTVIMAPLHLNYARANAAVARLAARYPGRFICFAFVPSRRGVGGIAGMVGHAASRWGVFGLKVHRLGAPATREVCGVARKRPPAGL